MINDVMARHYRNVGLPTAGEMQDRIDYLNQTWPKRAHLPKYIVVACEHAQTLSRHVQIVRDLYDIDIRPGASKQAHTLHLLPVYLTKAQGMRSPNSSEYMHARNFYLHPQFVGPSSNGQGAGQVVHCISDCDLAGYIAAQRTIQAWLNNVVQFSNIDAQSLYTKAVLHHRL